MSIQADWAVRRFAEGYSCSQAVCAAFGPRFGVPEEQALRMASAFGGGMARMGEVCGAVTGAFMAIGLAVDPAAPGAVGTAAKEAAYTVVREFVARFRGRHPSILCRELLGCSIDTPEGLQAARDRQLFATICPALVRDAVDLLEALLDGRPSRR